MADTSTPTVRACEPTLRFATRLLGELERVEILAAQDIDFDTTPDPDRVAQLLAEILTWTAGHGYIAGHVIARLQARVDHPAAP